MAKRLLAYEAIAQEIQSVILAGGYLPGSRMPDESELALRYGVGRSTIREALRLLGGRGYVRIAAGSGGGAFVNTGDATAVGRGFGDDLAFLMGGEAISVGELGEARRVQEVSSVRLAARRAGPAEIERIQQLAHDAIDHDVELIAAICENTAVLDFGELIAYGPTAMSLGDPKVRAAYLGVALEDS